MHICLFIINNLLKAYNQNSTLEITDESTLMEIAGFSVKVIGGDFNNFKITNNFDWEIFKMIARGIKKKATSQK